MRFFENLDEALPFFKAMSSGVRIQILKILAKEQDMNLNELARRIGITNGALTAHIRILEDTGIINTNTVVARHGLQKICSVNVEKYMVHIGHNFDQNYYSVEIAPGQYVDYDVTPTCGISTREKIIGSYDNPIYFADVEHFNAQLVYFTTGYVEYEIPNYVPEGAAFREILFQAELGSEAVAYCNDYKSDVYFSLNGVPIGVWQSPADYGGVRGLYNPDWWVLSMNQYGTLMEMRISDEGTFADGQKVSDVTIGQMNIAPKSKMRLRLAVPDGRGLTLYGRGFGNYNSGMMVRVNYEFLEKEGE